MNRRDHEIAAHQPWLRRLARRLAGSPTQADDLVQETCITALHKAPRDVQLRPWLSVVMRKLAWGQSRSAKRRTVREESFSLTEPALTVHDALVDHGFDREQLVAAIAGLPEPFHSTIVKRFLQGRSCAEIARSDSVPAGTVRWRQARGLEMLRAQLDLPRRQPVLWILPFLGTGKRLVARVWRIVGSGKALWLLVAATALICAISGSAVCPRAPDDDSLGDAHGRHVQAPLHASPGRALLGRAGLDDPGILLAIRSTPATEPVVDLVAAVEAAGTARRRSDESAAAVDVVHGAQGNDCSWDPVVGRRCASAPPSVQPTAALCAVLRRESLTADTLARASPTARHVLAAALLANRALAQRLGCPVQPASDLGGSLGATGDDPGCSIETRADGTPCTLCPGKQPVCAPAQCQSLLRDDDGALCTTCTDAHGEIHSDCPEKPPGICRSEIAESGLLCSTCDGQTGPPECLPAQCRVQDRCLSCTDPKGRVGTDCNIDYALLTTDGLGGAPNAALNLASCSFVWGLGNTTGTTCHYPGTSSCVVSAKETSQCLLCSYPDGTSSGMCTGDELPDPLASRPGDLPAPGTCINDIGADGNVSCTTCTRADLSAVRSCHYPGIASCGMLEFEDWSTSCPVRCTLHDGSVARVCNSPSGPKPMQ